MKKEEFVTTWAFVGSIMSVALFYLLDGQGHVLSRGLDWPDLPLRVVWSSSLVMWTCILIFIGERRSLIGLAALAGLMLVSPDLLVAVQERAGFLTYPLYTEAALTATWWTAAGLFLVAVGLDVLNWWDDRRLIEAKAAEQVPVEQ